MRPLIPTLALALAGALAWSPLAAQESPRARARATLSPDVFGQVEAVAREVEADGIPGDIVFNKALEGAAKHVPPDRLVPGVAEYSGRLREARVAFGRDAGGPLLVAGADALQRGVGPGLLQGLGRGASPGAGPGPSPVAVLVLADLVETGLGDEQALSLVREAIRIRARETRMLDMPAEVRRLLRQGRAVGDVVEEMRRALQRGRAGGLTPPVAPGAEPGGRARGRRGGGGG